MDAPDCLVGSRWFDEPSVHMVTVVVGETGLKDFPHSVYSFRRIGTGSLLKMGWIEPARVPFAGSVSLCSRLGTMRIRCCWRRCRVAVKAGDVRADPEMAALKVST